MRRPRCEGRLAGFGDPRVFLDKILRCLYTGAGVKVTAMKGALLGLTVFLTATMAWAGGVAATALRPAPAMDEPGLWVLAAGLVGAGLVLVRRRGGGTER